jgi:hypothetical protein
VESPGAPHSNFGTYLEMTQRAQSVAPPPGQSIPLHLFMIMTDQERT